jgi:hypothetical protein
MTNQIKDTGCKEAIAIMSHWSENGLLELKRMLDNKGIHNERIENTKDLKVSWCKSDIADKIKDIIEACTVPTESPEGKDIIAKSTMVQQVWEDGELTSTKGGSLYGQRGLHRIGYPSNIKIIETGWEDDAHESRVVKPECEDNIENVTRLLSSVGTKVNSLIKNKQD